MNKAEQLTAKLHELIAEDTKANYYSPGGRVSRVKTDADRERATVILIKCQVAERMSYLKDMTHPSCTIIYRVLFDKRYSVTKTSLLKEDALDHFNRPRRIGSAFIIKNKVTGETWEYIRSIERGHDAISKFNWMNNLENQMMGLALREHLNTRIKRLNRIRHYLRQRTNRDHRAEVAKHFSEEIKL